MPRTLSCISFIAIKVSIFLTPMSVLGAVAVKCSQIFYFANFAPYHTRPPDVVEYPTPFSFPSGEAARKSLEAKGYRVVSFEDSMKEHVRAVEIVGTPNPKLDAIVAALKKRGVTVVFDPRWLNQNEAEGAYLRSSKILLIDQRTLDTAQPSTTFLHELRHFGLYSKMRSSISTTRMILSLVVDSLRVPARFGANFPYKEQMLFQELSTHLQDMKFLLSNMFTTSDLSKGDSYLRELRDKADTIEAGLHRFKDFFSDVKEPWIEAAQSKENIRKTKYGLELQLAHVKFELLRLDDERVFIVRLNNGNKVNLGLPGIEVTESQLLALMSEFRHLRGSLVSLFGSAADDWSQFALGLRRTKFNDVLSPDFAAQIRQEIGKAQSVVDRSLQINTPTRRD
jgi:hypothetical protein